MADDDQDAGEATAVHGKRIGLSFAVLCAVGALLGGAAVSLVRPSSTIEVAQPLHEWMDLQHPDLMEFQLSPHTASGRAYISTSFYFVYRVRDDHVGDAFEAIRANWERARTRVSGLLAASPLSERETANGKQLLTDAIIHALDETLFGGASGGGERLARVTEVLWKLTDQVAATRRTARTLAALEPAKGAELVAQACQIDDERERLLMTLRYLSKDSLDALLQALPDQRLREELVQQLREIEAPTTSAEQTK